MKGFSAFLKKEFLELWRTSELIILGIIFALFGIMNPAIAKLTPWLVKMSADAFKSQGMVISEVKVTAFDSWTQFVKNMPVALIVLLIMFSGIFTKEYSKGTLIPILTKGLSRKTVVISKTVAMFMVWSICFWLSFGITYGYTAYYWEISVVKNIGFMAFCWWLMGIFLICIHTFFSSFANTAPQVMVGTGISYVIMYIMGMIGKIKEFLPTYILDSSSIMTAKSKPSDYTVAIFITFSLSVLTLLCSLPLSQKKQL